MFAGRGRRYPRPANEAKAFGGKAAIWIVIAVMVSLLSGCMYPNQLRKENQAKAKESVLIVQNAVEQYKQKNGVLPIKNSSVETPLYEKYVLDLKKLTQGPYLGQVPGIAFENGGSFMFVLVNPETKPEVKLLDVAAFQLTEDIQKWVNDYRSAHNGALPAGEQAGTNVYRLDFDKLGKKSEQVKSVYSAQYLSFIVDKQGTVGINYAPEIAKAMERQGMKTADANADLRSLLPADSPFVPVKSFPTRFIDNEPRPVAP